MRQRLSLCIILGALLLALPAFAATKPAGAPASAASQPAAQPAAQPSAQQAPQEEDGDITKQPLFKGMRPVKGSTLAKLGAEGQIQVPDGYYFLDAKDTKTILQRMDNKTQGNELGMVFPADFEWILVFSFDASGYVKDTGDEAKIDADAILKGYKESMAESNKQRVKDGKPTREIVGWAVKPHYNSDTKNLEWALTFSNQGRKYDNYNLNILGRGGVMEVTLVSDDSQKVLAETRKLISGYSFVTGKSHAEFRQGDKVAGYGVAALVGGGVVAAAAKSGILTKFLKPILAGLAVAGAAVVNLFRRKKKPEDSNDA